MNKKLAAALSGGAVLVLALSGCSDDDGDEKVNAWAKTFCDQAQPQFEKHSAAHQTIISTAADGQPADIKQADSEAFQDIAEADQALADAIQEAGVPPVDNGEQLQQDAITELEAASKAYQDLKKQVDALDASNQQAFANGLQDVAEGLAEIENMDQDALEKLRSGELGTAMSKQPGCQSTATSSPAGGAGNAESAKSPNASTPSAAASSSASSSASASVSARASASESASGADS
ncbi:small secreted protein [Streptomyces sp. MUM 178J]|uniref:small secreted protein n=1 Tax=Streptomyces sp. MUM 178J TaxID=2791991 RepID=UPI001F04779D|nr:small secreted protein [Streptomyces sp. MUM 178J]WRQ82163.1 small secreted protein [Streptomyces sp. MUM 178J]